MALGVLAVCGGPAETETSETPEAARWPQRVVVRFDAVVTRADEGADGSSIRLPALAVFEPVEVLEYQKGGASPRRGHLPEERGREGPVSRQSEHRNHVRDEHR